MWECSSNAVVIKYDKNNGFPIAFLAHELKHAYEFETGLVDLRADGSGAGIISDLTDEVLAYTRQQAFSTVSLGHSYWVNIDQKYVQGLGFKNAWGPLSYNSSLELINTNRLLVGRDQLFYPKENDPEYLSKTTYGQWSENNGQMVYINKNNYKSK